MKELKWILALALLAAGLVRISSAEEQQSAQKQEKAPKAAAEQSAPKAEASADEDWLNTVWTQVDDMVKEEEFKLQKTVTVAGVRGAEAEDQVLDKLYYKGAKRYPSQDKLKKAIQTLQQSLAKNPKSENAPKQQYFIAQCYEKLGQTAEARTYFARVLKDHAKSSWAQKAQKELTRLAAAEAKTKTEVKTEVKTEARTKARTKAE